MLLLACVQIMHIAHSVLSIVPLIVSFSLSSLPQSYRFPSVIALIVSPSPTTQPRSYRLHQRRSQYRISVYCNYLRSFINHSTFFQFLLQLGSLKLSSLRYQSLASISIITELTFLLFVQEIFLYFECPHTRIPPPNQSNLTVPRPRKTHYLSTSSYPHKYTHP